MFMYATPTFYSSTAALNDLQWINTLYSIS